MIAPGTLGLQMNTYHQNTNLLNNNAFIFPVSPAGVFDTSKPFQSPVISKSVECAFFTPSTQYSSLGLEFAGRLTSSNDAQPGQREVSIFMVAMASVGVTRTNHYLFFNANFVCSYLGSFGDPGYSPGSFDGFWGSTVGFLIQEAGRYSPQPTPFKTNCLPQDHAWDLQLSSVGFSCCRMISLY